MNPNEWLAHDLNVMSGNLCLCSDCSERRDHMLMQDVNLYGRKIAADIAAKIRRQTN